MGLGKTLTALWTTRLLGLTNCYCALVVGPLSILPNWVKEQQLLFPMPERVYDAATARQAFEHRRLVVVDEKLEFW